MYVNGRRFIRKTKRIVEERKKRDRYKKNRTDHSNNNHNDKRNIIMSTILLLYTSPFRSYIKCVLLLLNHHKRRALARYRQRSSVASCASQDKGHNPHAESPENHCRGRRVSKCTVDGGGEISLYYYVKQCVVLSPLPLDRPTQPGVHLSFTRHTYTCKGYVVLLRNCFIWKLF